MAIDISRTNLAIPQSEAEIDALIAEEAKTIGTEEYEYRPGVMKYDGGTFKVEDAAFVALEIEAVWLLSRKIRAFWGENEDEKRPICSSLDGTQGYWDNAGTTEAHLQGCAGCPNNIFGTDPKGGKGKACKEGRLLVGLVKGLKGPIRMRLSITSATGWDAYASGLARLGKPTAPFAVWTKSKLQEKQGEGSIRYFVATFEIGSRLAGSELVDAITQRRIALDAFGKVSAGQAAIFVQDVGREGATYTEEPYSGDDPGPAQDDIPF